MKIIRRFLNNHLKLDAIQYCIRHSADSDYCKMVLEREPMMMKCETWGELNENKNIYFIEFGDKNDGFFAAYRKLLNLLYYADYFQLAPVVRWTEDFLYAETVAVNDTWNPFEYYFEQPQNISLEDLRQSKKVFRSSYAHTFLAEQLKENVNGYELSEKYIDNMARITAKYIKLNSTIQGRFEREIDGLLKKRKILGVHVRGTDFKKNYNGHPIYISTQDYLRMTQEVMNQEEFERVFLATDDDDAVVQFSSCFKDKLLLYQDVRRTRENVSVAFSKENRKLHHYKLGLEVLRDMMTLASCDGLIAGKSQVSICAQITKRSWSEKFKVIRIMDDGLNINHRNFG